MGGVILSSGDLAFGVSVSLAYDGGLICGRVSGRLEWSYEWAWWGSVGSGIRRSGGSLGGRSMRA